jgi:chromosome segregation ATPase
MANYTSPIETTFELQRRSLEQGQQAIEQSFDVGQQISDSLMAGLDSQEQFQRQLVQLNRDTVTSVLDAIEGLPGADVAVDDLRENVDDGYEELLDGHADAFDSISEELENGADSYDELTQDLLDTIDEQLDLIVEAHEELEAQSVDAVDELAGQVEQLQEQADDVQNQIEQVSEEAAQAVEA